MGDRILHPCQKFEIVSGKIGETREAIGKSIECEAVLHAALVLARAAGMRVRMRHPREPLRVPTLNAPGMSGVPNCRPARRRMGLGAPSVGFGRNRRGIARL